MTLLINDIKQLREFIPQLIEAGRGEFSLLDKVSQYLEQAHLWFQREIASISFISATKDEKIREAAKRIIAAHALWLAIPAIDVTLSSTGFAVASTDSLAPASAARVKSLREAILSSRDNWISEILSRLPAFPEWADSFRASMMSSVLGFREASLAISGSVSFDSFRENFNIIRAIEDKLSSSYLGPTIFRLRNFNWWANLADDLDRNVVVNKADIIDSRKIEHVYNLVSSCIRQQLKYFSVQEQNEFLLKDAQNSVLEAVDFIRKHESVFPEWHAAPVAELFGRRPFPNSKRSGGYFF